MQASRVGCTLYSLGALGRRDSPHVQCIPGEYGAWNFRCGYEGDPLDVIALKKQPQLQHKKLLECQTPPGTLCFVLGLWLMPAPYGLHIHRKCPDTQLPPDYVKAKSRSRHLADRQQVHKDTLQKLVRKGVYAGEGTWSQGIRVYSWHMGSGKISMSSAPTAASKIANALVISFGMSPFFRGDLQEV